MRKMTPGTDRPEMIPTAQASLAVMVAGMTDEERFSTIFRLLTEILKVTSRLRDEVAMLNGELDASRNVATGGRV